MNQTLINKLRAAQVPINALGVWYEPITETQLLVFKKAKEYLQGVNIDVINAAHSQEGELGAALRQILEGCPVIINTDNEPISNMIEIKSVGCEANFDLIVAGNQTSPLMLCVAIEGESTQHTVSATITIQSKKAIDVSLSTKNIRHIAVKSNKAGRFTVMENEGRLRNIKTCDTIGILKLQASEIERLIIEGDLPLVVTGSTKIDNILLNGSYIELKALKNRSLDTYVKYFDIATNFGEVIISNCITDLNLSAKEISQLIADLPEIKDRLEMLGHTFRKAQCEFGMEDAIAKKTAQ